MNITNKARKTAIALAVSQMMVLPAQAATLTVDSLLDNLTSGDWTCTLREAIVSVNDGIRNTDCSGATPGTNDTIVFAPSITSVDSITLTLGELEIDSSVTINGPTAGGGLFTVDQQTGDSRVFDIINNGTRPVVVFNSLFITGGNSTGEGGGIRLYVSDLTLNDSHVSNNSAVGYGGGLSVSELSSIAINSSYVQGNYSEIYSGGLDVIDSEITINDSTISYNSAYGYGGGISIIGSTAQINGSTHIDLNRSYDFGGGIFIAGESHVTLSDYSHTYAGYAGRGGGISIQESTLILKGGAYLEYNYSEHEGGGLLSINSVVSVSDGHISGNSSGYDGGGVAIFGPLGSTRFDRTQFNGNYADENGGGIFVESGSVSVKNTTISTNASDNLGGGVFAKNNAVISLSNTTVSNNYSGAIGGGVVFYDIGADGVSATISNSIISGNMASGGGLEIGKGDASVLTLDGVSVFGHSANVSADSFYGFAGPSLNNVIATSDGNNPYALSDIIGSFSSAFGMASGAHNLPVGSPAIGLAESSLCGDLDQRKVDRGLTFLVPIVAANNNIAMIDLGGGDCDAGAVAFDPNPPVISSGAGKASAPESNHRHSRRTARK